MCLFFKIKNQRRAENGTRTRDPNLGKVVLYQLSYKVVLYQLSYFRKIFLAKVITFILEARLCSNGAFFNK